MNSYVDGVDEEAWCGGDPWLMPTMTVFNYTQVKTAHDAETSNTQRREALDRMLKSGQHRRLALAASGMMGDLDDYMTAVQPATARRRSC
ncbi:MAG: hypothetical protein PF501_05040 [Salinisphaera sp.]|jgi:hypothetical protein|nr:hypothetical protein [Salinisphaera sp.]